MDREPKILIYSPNDTQVYADLLQAKGYTAVGSASTPEEAAERLAGTEVLLSWKFPLHLLSRPEASSVKWIQSMGAGVDDLVSLPHIPEQIVITRIVDQFGGSIAEYVFAYLLYLNQDISRIRIAQKEKKWEPFLPGFLAGKTMGVAGLGSIGKEIAKKARAFDMSVSGLSYSGKQAHLVDQHYGPDEWRAFVQELDYLVLTLPLTDETRHVINRELLLAMKSTACLVNVGRGKLVVEEDLIDVLHSGHLQAAVLDVFYEEPLLKENPLWTLPNVYVTPHISGPSIPLEVMRFFADNVKLYLKGEPLRGVVNRNSSY
ncbi:D-2-hydroxyacid dehydrogenase [Aneurinibacillus tyrosinisolvens]|uniref:D-2-hydroxyacid dehydrogenase n=1 Tax=Aneurinibacillus tyrosinisolvens TaxID=1443435 RepID=UPI00069B21D3|nr:D-2-hydroxyacid dehydrogenase [Aneurinibacillus tyrosinisolvens]